MDYPHYSQADPQWGGRILGSRLTLQQAGCAITACAMLIAGETGRSETPKTLDDWMDRNGGYTGDSLYWTKIVQRLNQMGGAFVNSEFADVRGKNLSQIPWRSFGSCVLRVTGPSVHSYHFVLLHDASGKIHDPGTSRGANITLSDKGYVADRITWFLRRDTVISVYDAQVVLKRQGLYYGKIDGIYGHNTEAALIVFQNRFGLVASGQLDGPTSKKLVEVKDVAV